MSLAQLFDIVFFEKVEVLKVRYETGCFEKAEYLANTYKNCGLSGKLPKMTMYI